MKMNFDYDENLRFVPEDEEPTRDFVIVDDRGQRFESDDPHCLFDIVCERGFFDCRDYPTLAFMLLKRLKTQALNLSMQGVYAQVYDANGLIFDAMAPTAEFENPNDPVILDGWDAHTTLISLIQTGQYKVFEKVPWLTGKPGHLGCGGCAFFDDGRCSNWWNIRSQGTTWESTCAYAATGRYPDYVEATPERLVDPSYKNAWIPIVDRKDEMEGARRNATDSKQ